MDDRVRVWVRELPFSPSNIDSKSIVIEGLLYGGDDKSFGIAIKESYIEIRREDILMLEELPDADSAASQGLNSIPVRLVLRKKFSILDLRTDKIYGERILERRRPFALSCREIPITAFPSPIFRTRESNYLHELLSDKS